MSNETPKQRKTLVTKPVIIEEKHVTENFQCGHESLDDFLKSRALKNRESKATTTYVVCRLGTDEVVGYVSVATGSIRRNLAPKSMKRNMPDPIPVIVLGRLAVCHEYQGMGLGKALLQEAFERALTVSNSVGATAILLHAIDEDAANFYKKFGFKSSPIKPMTLMHSLKHSLPK